MDNCWLSCQVMADMKKVYDDLIVINLYLINIILRSSPALIAWILDLIAFITPLVDLTEVVDKGLATGWSVAGLAVYTVGLLWHRMPEKIFQIIDRTWKSNYKNKEGIKIVFWGQSKKTPKRKEYCHDEIIDIWWYNRDHQRNHLCPAARAARARDGGGGAGRWLRGIGQPARSLGGQVEKCGWTSQSLWIDFLLWRGKCDYICALFFQSNHNLSCV